MNIFLTKRAEKNLKKLPIDIQNRFFDKFEEIENHPNPFILSKKIVNCPHGSYRFRIADNYRAIFRIENNNIIIGRIGARKDIYKW